MPYKNKEESEKKAKGRPKKEIDKRQFEQMCYYQCTQEEICNILGVGLDKLISWCYETYNESFSSAYKKYSANGKMSLRRQQFRIGETSASMSIWLGKQYLGQRDNMDIKLSEEEDDAITKAIKGAFANEHESN